MNPDGYAMGCFYFPIAGLEDKKVKYIDLIRELFSVAYQTSLFQLECEGKEDIEKSPEQLIENYCAYAKEWKNSHPFYPNFHTAHASDHISEQYGEFYFSSNFWMYDKHGVVVEKNVHYKNLKKVLNDINHCQMAIKPGKVIQPITLNFHRTLNRDLTVISYNFTLNVFSDIYTKSVSNLYCKRLMEQQADQRESNFAKVDNTELSTPNLKRLNDWLIKMKILLHRYNGRFEIEDIAFPPYRSLFDTLIDD